MIAFFFSILFSFLYPKSHPIDKVYTNKIPQKSRKYFIVIILFNAARFVIFVNGPANMNVIAAPVESPSLKSPWMMGIEAPPHWYKNVLRTAETGTATALLAKVAS